MRKYSATINYLLLVFGISILFGVVVIPFLSGTLPWWLALILSPLGLIIYLAADEILQHSSKSLKGIQGKFIASIVFMTGGLIGAFALEWIKSLLS